MFTYMNCLSQLLANFIGIIYFFLSFLGAGWTELFRFYSSVETVYLLEFIFAYSMRQGSEYFNSQAYKELKQTLKGRRSGESSIPLQAFIQAGLRSDLQTISGTGQNCQGVRTTCNAASLALYVTAPYCHRDDEMVSYLGTVGGVTLLTSSPGVSTHRESSLQRALKTSQTHRPHLPDRTAQQRKAGKSDDALRMCALRGSKLGQALFTKLRLPEGGACASSVSGRCASL